MIIAYICLVVCMYVCEFFLFFVWYRLKYGNPPPESCSSFIKQLLIYFKNQFFHPHVLTDAPEIFWLLFLEFLLLPWLLSLFVLLLDNFFLKLIFFFVGLDIIARPLFRENKVQIGAQIDQWIIFFDTSEDYKTLLTKFSTKTKKHKVPLSATEIRERLLHASKIEIAILLVFVPLLVVFLIGVISDLRSGVLYQPGGPLWFHFSSKTFTVLFYVLLVLLFLLILIYVYSDRAYRDEEKRAFIASLRRKQQKVKNILGIGTGFYVEPSLKIWENSIIQMCNTLKIQQVAVVTENFLEDKTEFSGRIAMIARDPDGIPCIVLSMQEIALLQANHSPEMVFDMICFVLGHELTHLRYRNFGKKSNATKALLLLVSVLAVFLCGLYFLLILSPTIASLWSLILFFPCILCSKKVTSDVYWNYVNEYRADRIGAAISNISFDVIETLLLFETSQCLETQTAQTTHPDCEHRLKELQREKRWGVSEYFRYALRLNW